MKIQKLNNIYPYSQYIGKTINLQRDTLLCGIKLKPNMPFSFYLDGNGEPHGVATNVNYKEWYSSLKKGHPLIITEIFSTYSETIPNNTSGSHDKYPRNAITVKIRTEIPQSIVNLYKLGNNNIDAVYNWNLDGGEYIRKTSITSHIRRAPWEPESVPEKRYVGIMGDEMKDPAQTNHN